MKIIEKLLTKIVKKILDKERKERNDHLYNLSEYLDIIDEDELYSYEWIIKKAIEKEISQNVSHFFYWFQNYYWDRQKDIVKNLVNTEASKRIEEVYSWQIKEKIDKHISSISEYDIRGSEAVKNFINNYVEENKIDVTIKIRELLWKDEFFDTLCKEVGQEIWDDIRYKLECKC